MSITDVNSPILSYHFMIILYTKYWFQLNFHTESWFT